MKLDLRARRLLLEEKGVELELLSASQPQDTTSAQRVDLKLRRDVTVPPATEALVPVKRGGLRPGGEYLLESVGGEDSPVCAASCVIRPTTDDTLWVRVANVSLTEEVLRRNEVVATASTDFTLEGVLNHDPNGKGAGQRANIGADLSDAQREDMNRLISEFSDVFYAGGELPVVHVGVEHRINVTPGTRPVASRPRRLSPRLEGEVRKELQQLEAMGVIRQSHSPWAAPVVCARRKDGRLRLAIDYRRVNAVSAASTLHPIPLMEDLLDRLESAQRLVWWHRSSRRLKSWDRTWCRLASALTGYERNNRWTRRYPQFASLCSATRSCQVQDVFSRYLMLMPAEDNTAETAARLVYDRWICTFDVPLVITSDRGPHFAAETFRAMCRRTGVRHRMGAPQHAQSQGQVERQNQLIANLRCVCCNDVRVWPKKIFQLQFSHNTSVNSATGFSPFELLFARPARRPESAVSEGVPDGEPGHLPAAGGYSGEVAERRRLLDELHRETQVSVRNVQNARVQQSVARARGQPFEVGDAVRLRLTHAERSRKGGKMSPVLSQLYKVVEVLRGGWTYRVSRLFGTGKGTDIKIRHYNDLVRPAAQPDEVPRLESDASSGHSEPAPDGTESDVDDGDVDDGDGCLRDATSEDPESAYRRDPDGSDSRPRRQCGPPARLVIDPSRKRYEET
ncbi:uncharacterized protein LOC122373556 [Amphibalanus amphitrite]|uniref:uncharacterized protein LOC122373556 n=1 Tax=Amphibalanus amphitrite TaxID=1232801 RepID=UPI001C921011|nr:uncharacterized protein LOC122373556 [Amphibalanus amphitrite]